MDSTTSEILNIILLATVAGLFSSVLGGVIAIVTTKPSKKFIGLSFIFVATVLLTLVFIDFIPHAIGHGHYHTAVDSATGVMYRYWHQHSGAGIWLTILGLGVGIGLVILLSLFDKHGHEHIHGVFDHSDDCSHDDEPDRLTQKEKKRMLLMAIPVVVAIILHDLPKGLAIGSAGSITTALVIGLSCIPEGMTIAIPLKSAGMKVPKILAVCAFAGLATVIGAVIGYLLGGINVYFSGIMFAIAAGCIIGVVFSEIMPLALEYSDSSKIKFAVIFTGVAVVMIMNHFFHNLMH